MAQIAPVKTCTTRHGHTQNINIGSLAAGNGAYIFTTLSGVDGEGTQHIGGNDKFYHLLYWRAQLVTDANVANRQPSLQLFEHITSNVFWQCHAPVPVTASQTVFLNFCRGYFDAYDVTLPSGAIEKVIPFGHMRLATWERIRLTTAFYQAGDVYSNINIGFEFWYDNVQ